MDSPRPACSATSAFPGGGRWQEAGAITPCLLLDSRARAVGLCGQAPEVGPEVGPEIGGGGGWADERAARAGAFFLYMRTQGRWCVYERAHVSWGGYMSTERARAAFECSFRCAGVRVGSVRGVWLYVAQWV